MNELTGPSKQTLNLLSAVTGTVYVLLNKYQAYLKDTVKLELSFAETGKPELRTSPLEFQYPLENSLPFSVLTEKIAAAVEAYHDLSEENFTLHIKWISDDQANDYHIAIHIENGDVTSSDFSCKEVAFYAVVFKQAPNHFINVLQQVAENPGILLLELTFMDEQELDRLAGYQAGLVDNSVGTPELLHSLFERTAHTFPQNAAVYAANRQVNYQELDQAANKLAAELIEKGVKQGDFVGILLKRSPEVYLSMLAILKAGGAYVPLDTGYPEDRVSFILEDCGAKFLLSDEICSSSFKLSCEIIIVNDNSFEFIIVLLRLRM